jgi:two-component system sensor histidine kinase DesK
MFETAARAGHEPQPWARGWRRSLLAAGMLVYPGITAATIPQYSTGARAGIGYLLVAAFAACYVPTVFAATRRSWRWLSVLLAAMTALFVAELWFAQVDAFYLLAVIVSVTVLPLRLRAWPLAVLAAAACVVVPLLEPGWQGGPGWTQAVMVIFTVLLWYAFAEIARSNQTLVEARAEVARLASEAERNRIARDLHDLVGHSLTAITVKSNLARQLAAADGSPALREITEVEQLSRQALADVRAAVSGYREVTLAGELARARELLRASGIAVDVPTAVEPQDAVAQELFGWVIREGVTNVVRHARAAHCTIAVTGTAIEIDDDGTTAVPGEGNGLAGLRERATGAGASFAAGPIRPRGWRLRVAFDAEAPA